MSKPLILVVDDDPGARHVATAGLEAAGYLVVGHELGEPAIAAARELRPAAILLDLMMPGQDGISVAATLKADPRTANIPLIAFTAVVLAELPPSLLTHFSSVLTKPFTLTTLRETVGELVPPG